MAKSYLIELGINDSLPDVVRKCNQNFRNITSSQERMLKQETNRTGAQITNISNEIRAELKNAIDQFNAVADAKMAELEALIAEADQKIKELEDKLNQTS